MTDESFYQVLEKILNRFFITAHININWEWSRGKSYYKIFAEAECMNILNSFFGYNFIVCDKVNQKAIDWYCWVNDIWIQVTNRTDKNTKFKKETIDVAWSLEGYPNLKRLKFFVLQYGKWETYKTWTDLNQSKLKWDDFDFDNKKDIVTFDVIMNSITSETDLNKVKGFISTLIDLFPKEDWISEYNDLLKNWDRQKIEINNIIDGISANSELSL